MKSSTSEGSTATVQKNEQPRSCEADVADVTDPHRARLVRLDHLLARTIRRLVNVSASPGSITVATGSSERSTLQRLFGWSFSVTPADNGNHPASFGARLDDESVRPTQRHQAISFLLDHRITLAGKLFQARSVQHLDMPALVRNDAELL
jgi:hypothetical protein